MVKESIYVSRLRSNIITVINNEIYGGIFSGSNMKYPYWKEKILQAQLFFNFQYGRRCSWTEMHKMSIFVLMCTSQIWHTSGN
jgi:fucose 4-O-acetylase-like acetyltransferase